MTSKWNLPLISGLILAAGLIALVLLPSVVQLHDPHVAQRYHFEGEYIRMNPLKPGQLAGYPLGTDVIGRDLLSRLAHGARFTIGIALAIAAGRALLAVPIGIWAGWRGGIPARICSSLFSGLSALPTLFLIVVILAGVRNLVHRPAEWILVYVVVMLWAGVPRLAEQVRQAAAQVKVAPYMESAIAIGAPTSVILRRYVFRAISGQLLILLAVEMALILVTMGQLALLGLYPGNTIFLLNEFGRVIQTIDYIPEWGQMLSVNLYNFRRAPYLMFYPALGIGLSAICFQLLAEGMRQRRVRT